MIPITEKIIICQTHGVPDCIECSVPSYRCPVEGCLLTNPHTGKHAFRRSYHKDECQFNYDGKTCDGGCEPYPTKESTHYMWKNSDSRTRNMKEKNMEKLEPIDAVIGEYKDYFYSLTWVFKSWVPHWLKKFVATQHILQKDGKTERWGLYE